MRFKRRFLLVVGAALLAAILVIVLSPFAVSAGLRWWLFWRASQQNLIVRIANIDAPLFRPVVLKGVNITSTPQNPFHVDVNAAQMTLHLSLKAILFQTRDRLIKTLAADGVRAEIHRDRSGAFMSQSGWNAVQLFFPNNFKIDRFDLRMEGGPAVILLRNGALSASEFESGQFSCDEITVGSPLFRQTFDQLHGSTNWQNDHLTVAGLSLATGLDLQWITIDCSQLRNERVAIDFDLDAFGGKIRSSISNEWPGRHSNWNVVGSGNDISLEQTSEALGFTDRIDGLVHAWKFTFRGDPADPMEATASLWTELTGLSWRHRAAEVILLGATLNNRQIDIQQLYIKQSKNQLTLSGEAGFPAKSADWLNPDFRGTISGSINHLGDFAALFGATPGDFAGNIAIEGTMNARDRKIGGHLTLQGNGLTLFKTAIDNLSAKLNLKGGELEIEQLNLQRKMDSLGAHGKIDMLREHHYTGTLEATIDNLAEYWSIFRGPAETKSKPTPANLQLIIERDKWNVRGRITLPGSSPFDFTASFSLPINSEATSFLSTPLNATFDFPSIFLANAPQFFHPEVFHDGILSGKLSLSQTLQRPRIDGDLHLVNGKLQNASLNVTEASGRLTFGGQRASLDFLNASANNVDLSARGEIDFHDSNELVIRITAATPIFDLTPEPIDCVNKIEIGPSEVSLAPAISEIELRGPISARTWTMMLSERETTSAFSNLSQPSRKWPLCLGTNAEEKTLSLGAPPRPTPSPSRPQKKKPKRR